MARSFIRFASRIGKTILTITLNVIALAYLFLILSSCFFALRELVTPPSKQEREARELEYYTERYNNAERIAREKIEEYPTPCIGERAEQEKWSLDRLFDPNAQTRVDEYIDKHARELGLE
jgi:outer membrane lipopolysaccharide assembly protein LptE/RlpB